MNKRHLDHAEEILGSLLKSREDAAALFEPSDQLFDDAALSVFLLVKGNRPRAAIFIRLGRNHRLNASFQQVAIDPVSAVRLVARQSDGPSNWFVVKIDHHLVGALQQRLERGGFMGLSGRQMRMQRMAATVAEQVNLGRKTPARTA